jgi:hypothetical protein
MSVTVPQDNAEKLLAMLAAKGSSNVESVNSGTAVTLSSPTVATTTILTLNGATPAITLPAPVAGQSKTLYLVQDATGSRIPTWHATSGAIKWVGAAAPTLQTAAASVDSVDFTSYDGVNWVGFAKLHIA